MKRLEKMYKLADFDKINQIISFYQWKDVLNESNVNKNWERFYQVKTEKE